MPQISPGGLTVDYLRSCYRTTMRFSADPAAPLVPIRWKWVPPGTPTILYPTPFVSRVWDGNQQWDLPPALGEVGPRTWDAGGPGTVQWRPGFLGTEAQWRDGLDYAADWGEPGIGGPTPWACAGFVAGDPWPCAPIEAVGYDAVLDFPGWPVPYPGPSLRCPHDLPCHWFGLANHQVLTPFPILYQTGSAITVDAAGKITCNLGSNQNEFPGLDIVYSGWANPLRPNVLRVVSIFNPLGLVFPSEITLTWIPRAP